MEIQSNLLNNYTMQINTSLIAINDINYKDFDRKYEDYYQNKIIEKEKMDDNLKKVANEYIKMSDYMKSKISMKFGMEVFILVISTLLSIIGLLGKIFYF